jgi:tetratricopeptide (TPR) repeat protein
LKPARLPLAVAAGALTAVLSTVYDAIPVGLRFLTLSLVAALSGVALLLTDAGSAGPTVGGRDEAGDWPTSLRSGVSSRKRWLRRWWRRRRSGRPASRVPLFTGRESELNDLRRWHDSQRAQRGLTPAAASGNGSGSVRPGIGCVTLYLHGQAGVGKSALARQLAARLAPQYQADPIFVDLGTAGTARTPGEVLKDLILALGWEESEVPDDPRGRVITFRSMTAGKSLLFVFDAARSADQVKLILPTDPNNTVIITSRRDLTTDPEMQPLRSYLVDVPSEVDALRIFRAMSRTDDRDRPECAADIVQQCGRLPVAIRSAAERIAAEDTNICAVSRYLSEPSTRLSRLEQPGRPVRAILQAEYERLLPSEQRALRYLACLPSASFAPWILVPLLDVGAGQAEALTDRLAAAQLIEAVAPPTGIGLVRYRLHPLTRLFARQQAQELDDQQLEAALARADREYHAVVTAVLELPAATNTLTGANHVDLGALAERVRQQSRAWVDTEYLTILRQVEIAAERPNDDVCWRLGVLLDGATPKDLDYDATIAAYAHAQEAADRTGDKQAVAQTHVAKGRFFAAVGNYDSAVAEFDAATSAGAGTHDKIVNRLLLGEMLVRAGSHDLADEELGECLRLATAAEDAQRVYAAEILIAVNSHVECPHWVHDRMQDGSLDELSLFYAQLAFADSARRGREWTAALGHLDAALAMRANDLARTAFVDVRAAELHLQCARHLAIALNHQPEAVTRELDSAIQRACAAILRYRRMRYTAGEQRARCSLARAFGAVGLLGVAEQLAHSLKMDTVTIEAATDSINRAIVARVHQTSGELLYRFGETSAARSVLIEAASLFHALSDPMSETDVRDAIQRPPTVPRPRPPAE